TAAKLNPTFIETFISSLFHQKIIHSLRSGTLRLTTFVPIGPSQTPLLLSGSYPQGTYATTKYAVRPLYPSTSPRDVFLKKEYRLPDRYDDSQFFYPIAIPCSP